MDINSKPNGLYTFIWTDDVRRWSPPTGDDEMDCDVCGSSGPFEVIAVGTTCMYFPVYIDEHGLQHHHDGNVTTTTYRCQRCGKCSDRKVQHGSCACGWKAADGYKAVAQEQGNH